MTRVEIEIRVRIGIGTRVRVVIRVRVWVRVVIRVEDPPYGSHRPNSGVALDPDARAGFGSRRWC